MATSSTPAPTAVEKSPTTYNLEIEAFTLSNERITLRYEQGDSLNVTCQRATGPGVRAATVLIELGIDGYETHIVRVDRHQPFPGDADALTYGSNVDALSDAIDALTEIRDQLEASMTAEAEVG